MMIETTQSRRNESPTGAAHHHSGEEIGMELIEQQNGVQIVRDATGKYGLVDQHNVGPVSYRYRTLEMARKIATEVSAENDTLDAAE